MLDQAANGDGGLVLLGGEPGVGKTRLATEILDDGRERGMLALTGHASEDETAPFVIPTEILEEMVRLLPAPELRQMLGSSASELSRLLPELRQRYADIQETAQMPPEMQKRQLFKSVLEFLTRASAERPLVMLLDDIHWADESSLLLLEHIAARLAELPILMIGTYRDVEADVGKPFARALATLVRQRLAERMTVKAFDEGSVAEILTALGGSGPPRGLAHAIHEATEGNVFFIEETFRHLSEEGLLFDDGGAWKQDIALEHLDVPEGVRLVTARRLERLGESTRKVLSVASVIGLRFAVPVLEAGSPDGDAVLDALEQAEAAHLLRPSEGGRELRYEFVHALARQTAAERAVSAAAAADAPDRCRRDREDRVHPPGRPRRRHRASPGGGRVLRGSGAHDPLAQDRGRERGRGRRARRSVPVLRRRPLGGGRAALRTTRRPAAAPGVGAAGPRRQRRLRVRSLRRHHGVRGRRREDQSRERDREPGRPAGPERTTRRRSGRRRARPCFRR
jgi:hypothetical protein